MQAMQAMQASCSRNLQMCCRAHFGECRALGSQCRTPPLYCSLQTPHHQACPVLPPVLRSVLQKRYLIAGGGSPEMELSYQLSQWAKTLVVGAGCTLGQCLCDWLLFVSQHCLWVAERRIEARVPCSLASPWYRRQLSLPLLRQHGCCPAVLLCPTAGRAHHLLFFFLACPGALSPTSVAATSHVAALPCCCVACMTGGHGLLPAGDITPNAADLHPRFCTSWTAPLNCRA